MRGEDVAGEAYGVWESGAGVAGTEALDDAVADGGPGFVRDLGADGLVAADPDGALEEGDEDEQAAGGLGIGDAEGVEGFQPAALDGLEHAGAGNEGASEDRDVVG